MFLCDDCKYFTDKCEHPSNVYIKLERKIEKKAYILTEKQKACANYMQPESRMNLETQKPKSNKNTNKKQK
ncbi:hypothetical protein [Faecalibacillus faecis]|uniref:hypothetical protein n=1 Tax=Faecalibacillus faecis TaxID=1982628 RepID=UPI0038641F86